MKVEISKVDWHSAEITLNDIKITVQTGDSGRIILHLPAKAGVVSVDKSITSRETAVVVDPNLGKNNV